MLVRGSAASVLGAELTVHRPLGMFTTVRAHCSPLPGVNSCERKTISARSHIPLLGAMAKRPPKAPFKNSPAIEVIYHVQTALPQVGDMAGIERVLDNELKGFPTKEPFSLFKQTLGTAAGGPTQFQVRSDHTGFKFTDKKGQHVVHMLRDGLVVNWLKPYPGYAKCIAKFKSYWAIHQKAFRNAQVEGISLRYVNQIDLPLTKGTLKFSDYLNIGPRLPASDGAKLRGFHQVLDLVDPAKGIGGRATLMSLQALTDRVPVVLDIESSLTLKAGVVELWKGFDALHAWSHEVFNLCLNDRCRTLFV